MSTAPMTLVAKMLDKFVLRRGGTTTFYNVKCPCGAVNSFNALVWARKKRLPCAKCGLLISKETMEATKA